MGWAILASGRRHWSRASSGTAAVLLVEANTAAMLLWALLASGQNQGLAICAQSAHIGNMSKNRDTLWVEVQVWDRSSNPYRWTIFRGNQRMWVERAMHGYPTENGAYEAGQAALTRILSHKALKE
jgi:hypothetical protein